MSPNPTFLLAILFSFLPIPSVRGASCVTGFEQIGERCYYFSNNEGRANWTDARTLCQSFSDASTDYDLFWLDGGLQELQSFQEFLDMYSYNWDDPFLGLYAVGEGQWQWINGEPFSLDSYFWDCYFPSEDLNQCGTSAYDWENTVFNDRRIQRIRQTSCSFTKQYLCKGVPGAHFKQLV